MNEFLDVLSRSLKNIGAEEREEILSDYREHFEIGIAAGKTEAQVAASLGDPVQLAKMYLAHTATRRAQKSKRLGDTLRMLGAVASYKVGGGLIIGILYLICLACLLALFCTAICVIAAGTACAALAVINIIRGFALYVPAALFAALALISGGLLFFNGSRKVWGISMGRLPLLARRVTQRKGAVSNA